MAKSDMRLDVDFVDHPKTKKLIRKAGFESFYCLIKLFSTASKIYPKGCLKGCDASDIEDIAGWTGDEGVFINALMDEKIGFIDIIDDEYHIHDWEEHQPWIYHSDVRSKIAKKNADARWSAKTLQPKCDSHADSMQTACDLHNDGNAPTPPPLPMPIPKDNKERKAFSKPSILELREYAMSIGGHLDCDNFLNYYDSNGWIVGKTKMKDWKATVRSWIKRDEDKKRGAQAFNPQHKSVLDEEPV